MDIAARLLGSMEPTNAGTWDRIPAYADEVRQTVEDPFAALVIAFALGLLLYWLDPAYAAPEYQRYLPSEYLGRRLKEHGADPRVALSVYMHALNELMSDSLNERIILMGSMYRIGFDTVFATFVIGSLMAVGSALALGGVSVASDLQSLVVNGGWTVVATLVTGILAWRTRPEPDRPADAKETARQDFGASADVGRSALMVSAALLGILLFGNLSSDVLSSVSLILAYAVVLGFWVILRLRGPQWRDWLRTIRKRGTRSFAPTEQFELWQVVSIDGSLVVAVSLLLAAIGGGMDPIQVAVPNVLLLMAFILAYLRKYERQLHAVYWNQHTWIDLNLEQLLKLAESLAALGEATSSTGTKRSDSDEKETAPRPM